MGSHGGKQADPGELLSPTLTRREAETERHRAVARALHAGPPPQGPQLAEKLDSLRAQIAQFRARAIDLHVKLVELETSGDPDVRSLRSAMMASVVRIEGVVREMIDAPAASPLPAPVKPPRGDR